MSGIGKLTQAAFALVSPGRVLSNLVAGAASEAAAQQAGDMMQDFKTAYLLGVSPRAQFWAMLIGSGVSCVVSTGAYLLYTAVYPVGDSEGKLPAPTAHIWLAMARLVTGEPLPQGVQLFCYAGGAIGAALAVAPEAVEGAQRWLAQRPRSVAADRWHQRLTIVQLCLPNGIGLAIGMYVLPRFVLPRVIGSVAEQAWLYLSPRSHSDGMLVVASGLVLGEGIATLVSTVARALLGH